MYLTFDRSWWFLTGFSGGPSLWHQTQSRCVPARGGFVASVELYMFSVGTVLLVGPRSVGVPHHRSSRLRSRRAPARGGRGGPAAGAGRSSSAVRPGAGNPGAPGCASASSRAGVSSGLRSVTRFSDLRLICPRKFLRSLSFRP